MDIRTKRTRSVTSVGIDLQGDVQVNVFFDQGPPLLFAVGYNIGDPQIVNSVLIDSGEAYAIYQEGVQVAINADGELVLTLEDGVDSTAFYSINPNTGQLVFNRP